MSLRPVRICCVGPKRHAVIGAVAMASMGASASAQFGPEWIQRQHGTFSFAFVGIECDIAVDRLGGIYVVGTTGDEKWVSLEDLAGRDRATAIKLDTRGDVYLTGWSDPDSDESNMNEGATPTATNRRVSVCSMSLTSCALRTASSVASRSHAIATHRPGPASATCLIFCASRMLSLRDAHK